MSEHQSGNLIQSLRARDACQGVGSQGRPATAHLTLDETNRTLGLLDDETDCRDEDWAAPQLRQWILSNCRLPGSPVLQPLESIPGDR